MRRDTHMLKKWVNLKIFSWSQQKDIMEGSRIRTFTEILYYIYLSFYWNWTTATRLPYKYAKKIRRYQSGRQKSLSRKTDKIMANKNETKDKQRNHNITLKTKAVVKRNLQKPG